MRKKPLCKHCGIRHDPHKRCPNLPTELQSWYDDWKRRKKARGEWESKKSFKSKPLRSRRSKGRVTFEELRKGVRQRM